MSQTNSNGLHSVHSDEDARYNNNKSYLEFNEETDMKNSQLSLRLIFRDVAKFRKAIKMHYEIRGTTLVQLA